MMPDLTEGGTFINNKPAGFKRKGDLSNESKKSMVLVCGTIGVYFTKHPKQV
jgi:hypothetical protein